MKKLKRYLRLYSIFISQFLKLIVQSKVDFFIGIIGFFFTQIIGILFLYLVFGNIPSLNGWTLDELIFIYGFAQIPRGIDHLFTDNIWIMAWRLIVNGDFDRYMLRPMNVFFQLIAERLQPDAVGELVVGGILVSKSIADGIVICDIEHIILFIVSIIAGAFIYTAIKLFFASFAFWIKVSGPVLYFVYQFADFAKYPTDIYSRPVKFIITWIIPFGFVAYLPASYFLKSSASGMLIGIECIIAAVFSFIAYAFFSYGIKGYESAGN
ncbi:ABC-2 family transporter protein [Clostridium sp. BJN0001]|uniref:ABC transporter permease n=1 Tax=Clostridium sp. BJN0001 TaxID=2930219 RepID=UPI001FD5F657|nr:ABC-2 family transporter protein [Clostridium sp. BJN0001]